MTPHEEVKERFGYIRRANCCGNCNNFEPSLLMGKGGVIKMDLQDRPTCSIGNFPVNAKSCCNKHKKHEATK